MTSQEIPPRDEVEKYEDTRILQSSEEKLSEQKAQEATERVIEEKGYLSQQDKARIAEIESSFKPDSSERIAEIHSIARQKPLGDETWSSSTEYSAAKTQSTNKGVWGGLKRAALGLTALFGVTVASEAKGVEKNPSDSTKGNKTEVNFNTARKVKEIPSDYETVIKDGIKYGVKVTESKEPAAPTTKATFEVKKRAPQNAHHSSSKSFFKKATPAHAVAQPKENVTSDVVYIEAEQEQPKEISLPKFAEDVQRYYGANGHAVGDGAYTVRESMDETQGGTVNTYDRTFRLDLIDEMGNPTDTSIVIPGAELQHYLVSNSTHFKSPKDFEEAKQKYSVKKGSTTYAFTGKEIADGTTLK